MKNSSKKITAWVLAAALTVMTVFPSYAADFNTEKREMVSAWDVSTLDVSSQDVSNPDADARDRSDTDGSNQNVSSPDVSGPDISGPDVSNPDVNNPDVSNPDVSSPDVSNPDVSNPDVSGPDVSGPDVSDPDVSGPDVSDPDVSASDVSSPDGGLQSASDGDPASMKENFTHGFWVERSLERYVGSYTTWQELVDGLNQLSYKRDVFYIEVYGDAVIGSSLPTGFLKFSLAPQEGKDTLYFAGSSFTIQCNTDISSAKLCVNKSGKPVNLVLKGGNLKTVNVPSLGAVTGTGTETWTSRGETWVYGVIQKLGTMSLQGNVHALKGVKNVALWEAGSRLYAYSGQKYIFQNVKVTLESFGMLVLQTNGSKLPEPRITGTIEGALKVIGSDILEEGQVSDKEFQRGQKLLSAPKASIENFCFANERKGCKVGDYLYYGDPFLVLYEQDEVLGQYFVWEDVLKEINLRKASKAEYRVVFDENYTWKGAWKMPTKGRCKNLYLEGTGQVTLEAASLTATSDLRIGSSVIVEVKNLSAASYDIRMDSGAKLRTGSSLTVNNLTMMADTGLTIRGKGTIKNQLSASVDTESHKRGSMPIIYLAQGKMLSVKNTAAGEYPIVIIVTDQQGEIIDVPSGTTLVTTTGNTYPAQFRYMRTPYLDASTYKKGNTIKTKGMQDISYSVDMSSADTREEWGFYEGLADVKAEVNRRKDSNARIQITVLEDSFVKGSIPFPSAGKYKELQITGKAIYTTGNVQLTGTTILSNQIIRVKKQGDTAGLPLTVNLSKYKLILPEGTGMDRVGSITGAAKSCLQIEQGLNLTVENTLKAAELVLNGTLDVKGNWTVTNITYGKDNCLSYEIGKNSTISGTVSGEEGKLRLAPRQKGAYLESYQEGTKILNAAPRLDLGKLEMRYSTEYVFYRDGSAVRLGTPALLLYSGTSDYEACREQNREDAAAFVKLKDAVDSINVSEGTEYVLCALTDINQEKNFVSPGQGKKVILCSRDGQRKELKLPKTVTLTGGGLELHDMDLKSGNTVPGFTLKNGAALFLEDASVNGISAVKGTSLGLAGEMTVKGAVTGAGSLSVQEGAVVRTGGDVAAAELKVLEQETVDGIEFRLRKGKKLSVSEAVSTTQAGQILINIMNGSDELEAIPEATVLAVTPYGEAEQFKTENRMTGSLLHWGLEKSGKNIRTTAGTEGPGEWSGDFY